jgi:fatty acid desaturase
MPDAKPNKNWETFLALALLLLLGGGFFVLLNFFFGAIGGVLTVVVACVMVGYLHYLLWGYALSRNTAGEREQAQLHQRLEAEQYQGEQDPF